jgi:hypothetical protein
LLNVITGLAAFWQTAADPEIVAPGVGRIVAVVEDCAVGPLHPAADTEIVALPVKPGAHVTVPVGPVPEIVLPEPVTFQLYDVAFAADVVNSVVAVPWQIIDADGVGVTGITTPGRTTTVPVAHAVVLHVPEALT